MSAIASSRLRICWLLCVPTCRLSEKCSSMARPHGATPLVQSAVHCSIPSLEFVPPNSTENKTPQNALPPMLMFHLPKAPYCAVAGQVMHAHTIKNLFCSPADAQHLVCKDCLDKI